MDILKWDLKNWTAAGFVSTHIVLITEDVGEVYRLFTHLRLRSVIKLFRAKLEKIFMKKWLV